MDLIGAVCVGLVWGWLAHHLYRPASRRRQALTIVISATAAAALYHGWRLDLGGAQLFAAGALVGAVGYGLWWEELARWRAARRAA